jgi:hypothetical protein
LPFSSILAFAISFTDKIHTPLSKINLFFRSKVEISRIKVGKKQEIETLIAEEALLFAKYLREEIPAWNPRIAELK